MRNVCVLVLFLMFIIHFASGHRTKITRKADSKEHEDNGEVSPQDHQFFLKQIFDKYGHEGIISFEGFEHLLENLGLGRLVFEKTHTLSLHKVNGSFQEVHDSLNLHQHSHEQQHNALSPQKRKRRDLAEVQIKVTSYAEPKPLPSAWRSRCLTPQDLLQTFGLEPHHKAAISQRVFLEICPAIIYELDQRTCYDEVDNHTTSEELNGSSYSVWLYASLSVLVISLIGLLGVAMVPMVQRAFFHQIINFLVALAVGTMCGDALLHLLPHALIPHTNKNDEDHLIPIYRASVAFLAIVVFFMLEAIVHNISKSSENSERDLASHHESIKEKKPLNNDEIPETRVDIETNLEIKRQSKHQHSHQHSTEETVGSVAWMVIMGDGLHNLTDGLAIGAAFSGDIVAGFATAVAVLCHELPHELGDFAVLLKAGMSIKSAVIYNIVSSILSFIGMAIGVWLGEYEAASMWIYAFTAGTFLYISLVDLIPEMKNYTEGSKNFMNIILQIGGIFSGAGIMLIIALYEDDLSSMFS